MSFFSLGFLSGQSSPKQKVMSKGGGFWASPLWNRISPADRRKVHHQDQTKTSRSFHPVLWLVTLQEVIEAKHFDLPLPLHRVRWTLFGHAWSGPEHFTLTEPDGVDILLPDLQDQTTVHHIQQGLSVELLLLVLDLRRAWEQDLLQGDGSKQVHLLGGRLQVSIVQPTALRVTDGQWAHRPAPVLELQV